MRNFRRLFGALFSIAAITVAIVAIVLTAQRLDHRPRTDDAFIDADIVHMAPDVSGRVIALNVRDNQLAHLIQRITGIHWRM